MGILKPYVKRKLMNECLKEGYTEDECRKIVEAYDKLIEETVTAKIRKEGIISGSQGHCIGWDKYSLFDS